MTDFPATDGRTDFRVDVDGASGNGPVVAVAGDLDLHSGPELRDRLTLLTEGGARHVTVDLTDATFLDSMALGVILGAKKRLVDEGGELDLIVPTPEIRRIFEITMLDRVFEIYASREEAVGSGDRGTS